jgi:hypothetical protein
MSKIVSCCQASGRWLLGHPWTVLAILALVPLSVSFSLRTDNEWEAVYVRAAGQLWLGADLYDGTAGYLYPPFMAWAALPFLALPPFLVRLGWLLINLLSLLVILRGAWRASGGPALQGASAARPGEQFVALLGLVCGVCYLQNCWAHLQTDIVLAALLLQGVLFLVRDRWFSSAVCFGLAAACKCTPLLLAPWLVWRRRPLPALVLVAVAIGVNLLPDLVSRPASGRPWLAEYGARYLAPLTRPDHYAGSWGSYIVYNQSLAGAGQRWLATSWHWEADDCTISTHLDRVHPVALRVLVAAACLVVLLGSLWACRRPWQPIASDETLPGGVPRVAVESGVVFLLMLLLSPMSSKAHFGTLILPGFCLARAALASRRKVLWGLLATAVVLAVLSNKDPLGERLYTLSLWYGVVTWETLVLLVGSWCLLRGVARTEVQRTGLPALTRRAA